MSDLRGAKPAYLGLGCQSLQAELSFTIHQMSEYADNVA